MFRTGKLRRWAVRGTESGHAERGAPAEASPDADKPRVFAETAFSGPLVRGGRPQPEVRRRECRLDGDPQAVRTARALVTNALRAWGRADLLDDATLVVSELVTNALVHGSPPVTIAVTYESDLVIEVTDAGPELPVKCLPGSGGHFGVWLAEELCDLHVRPRPIGKTIRAAFRR
jgi:hypothetical protein